MVIAAPFAAADLTAGFMHAVGILTARALVQAELMVLAPDPRVIAGSGAGVDETAPRSMVERSIDGRLVLDVTKWRISRPARTWEERRRRSTDLVLVP